MCHLLSSIFSYTCLCLLSVTWIVPIFGTHRSGDGLCDSLFEERNERRLSYAQNLDQYKVGERVMKCCRPYDIGWLRQLNNYVTLSGKEYDAGGRLVRVIVVCEETRAHYLGPRFFDGWISTDSTRQHRELSPSQFLTNGSPL